MPARGGNLIRMAVTTSGAIGSTLAMSGPVTGFRDLNSLPDGSFVHYAVEDTGGNMTGYGVVQSSGRAVTFNFIDSNTGSALSLSGGAQLIVTALARDLHPMHQYDRANFGGL